MFTTALVKNPSKSMTEGISTAQLGLPDYSKALEQHAAYTAALKACGLKVITLEADEAYPDSTFVEDTALLTPHCAIITRPGAVSRSGEIADILAALKPYFKHIECVQAPGTVDGGDIMMVGPHFYIGLSERTNQAGAEQVIAALEKHGLTGSTVAMNDVLHLKTGVSYLEQNKLVATGEFLTEPQFQKFNLLEISAEESYAANCIWVNDTVLIARGYPKAKDLIESAGYSTLALDVSEFKKLDGGLSCLSLRF